LTTLVLQETEIDSEEMKQLSEALRSNTVMRIQFLFSYHIEISILE